MRIGIYLGSDRTVGEVLDLVRVAAGAGLHSVFLNQTLGWDALTVAALAIRETPGIEVGTAVTQTFPRHPITLASQARTVAALGPGRFTLGVGPSHPRLIEDAFGLSYARPAAHTREYLSVLAPLLRGEPVDHRGPTIHAEATVEVDGAAPPPVLLSALAPAMLRIAGEIADGVVTVWNTPTVLADHVVPRVRGAAADAGRPAPRIATVVSTIVTDEPDRRRAELASLLAPVSELPSYRKFLDRQGLSGVHETALLGDEAVVSAGVRAFAEAGVTDLIVSLRGDDQDRARGLALLSELARAETNSSGPAIPAP